MLVTVSRALVSILLLLGLHMWGASVDPTGRIHSAWTHTSASLEIAGSLSIQKVAQMWCMGRACATMQVVTAAASCLTRHTCDHELGPKQFKLIRGVTSIPASHCTILTSLALQDGRHCRYMSACSRIPPVAHTPAVYMCKATLCLLT